MKFSLRLVAQSLSMLRLVSLHFNSNWIQSKFCVLRTVTVNATNDWWINDWFTCSTFFCFPHRVDERREKNPWVMNHLAQWVHRDAIACTTEFGWVCAWVIATVVNRASTYERNATTTDCFKRVHRTLKRKTHFNFTNWWIKCESQRAREREGGREEDEKLKRND